MAGIYRTLAEEYRQKLVLQEARFCTRRDELQGEADSLKEKLVMADQREKARAAAPGRAGQRAAAGVVRARRRRWLRPQGWRGLAGSGL